MTVNHGVLGSSPCSGADTRGLRIESSASRARPPKGRMTPSRPQEKIRAKICRIENFAYLCNAQAIFRELSSAGSERLPYKQRVGGSNPSAPTPEAFHESERLFSYIHLPSFRLYPSPSQISHQRPDHVKHQGSKRALFSKIHIAHPKKTGETSLRSSQTGHHSERYPTRQRRMGTRQQKTSAIGGGLGVGLPRFELGMTGPESVVLPLHHSPMICSCRKDDAKVELNFLSAKKNRCFFTFSFCGAPKSTSDAPEHPPRRHTATP